MSARIREIADAIVADLNLSSQTWQQPSQIFTAVRTNEPVHENAEYVAMQVDLQMIAQGWAEATDRDGGELLEVVIQITFQQKVDVTSNGQTDPLVDLVTTIAGHYAIGTAIPELGGPEAQVAEKANVILTPKQAFTKGVWCSILTLTIRELD